MASTKKSRDFLDKELFVKRNIVTFRSLSRGLGIHVDDAKKELQQYYDSVRDTRAPAVPTYLVTGEVPSKVCVPPEPPSDSMDVDLEFEEDHAEDVVHETEVLLVDARALEETRLRFSRVYSVHIYSLSPARFGDAGLVCVPTEDVRKADVRDGPASFAITGRIVGPHVKRRAGHQHMASSSKTTLDVPSKAVPKDTEAKGIALEKKEQSVTLPKTEPKDKPKLSGKLDWSKAKTKEKEPAASEVKGDRKPKPEPESGVVHGIASTSKKIALEPVSKPKSGSTGSANTTKRGVKRKPHMETEEEEESDAFPIKADPRIVLGSSVKQEITDSDSDEDGKVRMLGLRRAKRKSTVSSNSEMSLRAMMDIDDELVDRVARGSKLRPEPQESEESSEEEREKEATAPPATSEDEESDHVPVVQKKRKPRKVVPVGRNGLKKRRIVKRRTTTDPKGYMQTEDYSSYESVEEEEEEKPKVKTKAKEVKKVSERAEEPKATKEEGLGKPKAKTAAKPKGGAPKRGGLLNFFGPERGKK